MLTRRAFLATSAASLGFAALRRAALAGAAVTSERLGGRGGPLALPPGFEQVVLSRAGEEMSDGLLVPGLHDGMGCFTGPDGTLVLVRNHEIIREMGIGRGAFGPKLERLDRIDRSLLYDPGRDGIPSLGGTTTVVFDPASRTLRRHFMSLAGTGYNCAGGPTPWGTWITCEEWTQRANDEYAHDHGWCFEVKSDANGTLQAPRRLPALGRFRHEAVAVSPAGRIAYLTEDVEDGCLYRFVAERPGDFAAGGRLQALAAAERPSLDTRNWPAPAGETSRPTVRIGEPIAVRWIDLDEVEAPLDDLRLRAWKKGAARFARCEGIWYAPDAEAGDAVFLAATTGGPKELGQIWRYRPSPHEGTPEESAHPGTLDLFVESSNSALLENADNLTVAPWGDLFLCEDGAGTDGIVRVTRDGSLHRFAENVMNESELAGPCFSPDGAWLFVNIQDPGLTIAITGPWKSQR